MKITIAPRSRKLESFLITNFPDEAKVHDLKKAIHEKLKFSPSRQRLTFNDNVLEEEKSLKSYNIKDGDTIQFKDLGLQIGWRTVFIVEYFGPLLIHPIIYHCQQIVYGQTFPNSKMQTITYYFVMLHFIKRELESLFVHRFSHGTMPFRNIFKNSFHYHVLAGLNIAYWVYGPWFSAEKPESYREEWYIWACVAVWTWAELSNLSTHITLRNLRPPGTRIRNIPYGYGFGFVSCPNYFFELTAWAAVLVLTRSFGVFIFLLVSFVQTYLWALKKHKAYRKEFKDYPRNRKIIIPYLI